MARSPTRTRKVLLAITLAMLAVVLAAWGVSWLSTASVERTSCTFSARKDDPHGTPIYDVAIEQYGVHHSSGRVRFFHNIGSTVATGQADLDALNSYEGWTAYLEHAPRLGPDFRFAFYALDATNWHVLGLGMANTLASSGYYRALTIPHWLLTAILAPTAFLLWFPQRRSASRRAEGLCLRCGYDRRGLAPAAACPECGASASASVADAKAPPTV